MEKRLCYRGQEMGPRDIAPRVFEIAKGRNAPLKKDWMISFGYLT
jgi:hypothetical protein